MIATAQDLTQEPPSSPRMRIHNYVILARLADKARAAFMGGNVGEYHTDCPLDHKLLDWKGVTYDEIKKEILAGSDNENLALYLDKHGMRKTPEQVKSWSDEMEKLNPYADPEKREWYAGEVKKLGLRPESTTLFDWLEADDRAVLTKTS